MTREEAQPAWENILVQGITNYEALTRAQRVWYTIEPLITDGLWDHYTNMGADNNNDTIEDLDYLNFQSVANLLREFNKTYFPKGVPQDVEERYEQLEKFSEKKLEADIEKMEEIFWKIAADLDTALLEHINNTGIAK